MEVLAYKKGKKEKNFSSKNRSIADYGVYLAFVLLILINVVFTDNFFSINTLWNLITYSTTVLLVSMGMNLVIATGGIDISVGSTMALSGTILALLLPITGVFPAIIVAIIAAMIVGMFTGTLISKFNIQPIIASLAMMMTIRGIAQILSLGKILNFNSDILSKMAYLRIGGIVPIQLVISIIVVGVFYLMVTKSIWGRYIEALGDNKEAAHIMGINIERTARIVYMIVALMAGLAGILQASRLLSTNPNSMGHLIELDAIAAVAIGGTKMSGGKPKIINTVVGVFIMQLITMTINMNDIQYSYALIIKTIIIILAVYIQREKTS